MVRKFGILLDLDGLLIDMRPFAYELESNEPNRWRRFFAHTDEAGPVPVGLHLVEQLSDLGWFYSVSTTRPAWTLENVRTFLQHRMPVPPKSVYARENPTKEPAVCKAQHYRRARQLRRPNAPTCTLFIDDELCVVDKLTQLDVPALHISDLPSNERDLLACLKYSKVKLLESENRPSVKTTRAS